MTNSSSDDDDINNAMLRRRKRSRVIIGSNSDIDADSAPAYKRALRIGAATPFGNGDNIIEEGANSSGNLMFVLDMIWWWCFL